MRDYKTFKSVEIFSHPVLDKLREKVESFYECSVRTKSRREEHVVARVVFQLMAADLGFHSAFIGKYIGVDRTTVSNNRSKFGNTSHYKEQIALVEGFLPFQAEIETVNLQIKFEMIKEHLEKLSVKDMPELINKMDMMHKAKQWKTEDKCKTYTSNQVYLED